MFGIGFSEILFLILTLLLLVAANCLPAIGKELPRASWERQDDGETL